MRRWLPGLFGVLWLPAGLAAGLQDPTRPYPQARWHRTPATSSFAATQIAPDGRRALIDGRWVHVGERIRGFRVRAIRHGEVVLEGRGRRWVIRLAPLQGIAANTKRTRE